jgi:hypothetical protein
VARANRLFALEQRLFELPEMLSSPEHLASSQAMCEDEKEVLWWNTLKR